jgi:hypothetical protein
MRKLLITLAVVFMIFSFSMAGFADVQSQGVASQIGKAVNPLICGPGETYAGEIAWVYPGTESMMVSGRGGRKIFDLSKATMEGFPEANQFVAVNYRVVNGDRIASSVTVVPWKMAHRYVGEF